MKSRDVDMDPSDTIKSIARIHILQVNSSSNYKIYYFDNKDKITKSLFISCRIVGDLFKPCAKIRLVYMYRYMFVCTHIHIL